MDQNDLDTLIQNSAAKYGLDPDLFSRQLFQESGFNPRARSPVGAVGIAQFMPATARRYGVDPTNVPSSIEGAAHYMSDLKNMFGGNTTLALAGYNWGEGNVQKWLHGGWNMPAETQNYIASITGNGPMGNRSSVADMSVFGEPKTDLLAKYALAKAAQQGQAPASNAPAPAIAPTIDNRSPAPPMVQSPVSTADMSVFGDPSGDPLSRYAIKQPTEPSQANAETLPPPSQANSAVTGFFNGIPIAGPYALSGMRKLAAWGQSSATGQPYGQALSDIQNYGNASTAAYPKTALAGGLAGGVAGTVPLMAAAPWAVGAGSGPLIANMALGGLSGAALNAGDAAIRAGSVYDPSVLRAAELGGAFGFAGPAFGGAIARGTALGANVAARTTPAARNVADVMSQVGMTVPAARAALSRMPAEAMPLDLNPALTTEAGAVASKGGAATSILKGAMAQRAAGADDQILNAATTYLGPRPDLTAMQEAIKSKASASAGPYYDAARASPISMDVAPILSSIDAQIPNASGGIESLLKTVKGFLINKVATANNPLGAVVPKDESAGILGARQALDDIIYNKATGETKLGGNALRIAGDLRGQLDNVLKADPNIAAGDAAFAEQMQNRRALDAGTEIFKPENRIEDVQRSVAAATPSQTGAMQMGALSAVHDALANARQGDLSAARSMFAKASSNRAKLDALFPQSGQFFDELGHRLAMRDAEQTVARNSETAARQSVGQKYEVPTGGTLGSIAAPLVGEAMYGGPGAIVAAGANMARTHAQQQMAQNAMLRLREGTARILSAPAGPERDALLASVERAQRTNAMSSALAGGASGGVNMLTRSATSPLEQYFNGQQPALSQ